MDISKRTNNNLVNSNPRSNRPETVYWSYNLSSHYLLIHPGIKCPEQLSKEEYDFIKKITYKQEYIIILY